MEIIEENNKKNNNNNNNKKNNNNNNNNNNNFMNKNKNNKERLQHINADECPKIIFYLCMYSVYYYEVIDEIHVKIEVDLRKFR